MGRAAGGHDSDVRVTAGPGEELGDQTGLAGPGRADDDDVPAVAGGRGPYRLLEEVQLAVPPDERRPRGDGPQLADR